MTYSIVDGVVLKRCGHCKKWLGLESFSKNRSRSDGLHNQCKGCAKIWNSGWYDSHKDEAKAWHKKWRNNNLGKIRVRQRLYDKKLSSTLKGRLQGNMRTAVRRYLQQGKKNERTFDLLGYTPIQMIKHLAKTMPEDCSWADYMSGKLHVDHIIPISAFNFEKPEDEDFKKCWALKNLQLLPASANARKNNKLDKPFQPSLIFGLP